MKTIVVLGGFPHSKKIILEYCISNFEKNQIWLIDSLQVFDPYSLSRIDTQKTRELLQSMKISRPFTFYQLKDKIFSLTKMDLGKNPSIIISSLDCFNDEVEDPEKKRIVGSVLLKVLKRIQQARGCDLIIGVKDIEFLAQIQKNWEVVLWEEQLSRQGMKLTRS